MSHSKELPKAIVVCGMPGSGKSTYARELSSKFTAVLLDIDTVTEKLVQLGLSLSGHDKNDRDSDFFKTTFRGPIYETLFAIARENILIGKSVIIVGPFTKELMQPDWPSKLRMNLGAEVEIHYLTCKLEVMQSRLAGRNNPRDAAKLKDWEKFQTYYGTLSGPVFEHILVDTTAE